MGEFLRMPDGDPARPPQEPETAVTGQVAAKLAKNAGVSAAEPGKEALV
jgi:hypothetical protein